MTGAAFDPVDVSELAERLPAVAGDSCSRQGGAPGGFEFVREDRSYPVEGQKHKYLSGSVLHIQTISLETGHRWDHDRPRRY